MINNSRRRFFGMGAAALGVATFGWGAIGCCGPSKKALSGPDAAYAGRWEAADGSFIVIGADGSGECKIGSTTITGGNAFITGGKLKIGLGPIDKELTIDSPPATAAGHTTVKLSGVVYTKK
jgi:hypothetical protein